MGVGGKPSRQGAREGACDSGHRKRRRAHGTLLDPEYLDTDTPSKAWTEMNVNILTKTDGRYSPEHGTYTLRGFTVKVYPAPEGAPEGAWINPTDFEPWMPEFSESTEVVFK